jgi:hypothetical protein
MASRSLYRHADPDVQLDFKTPERLSFECGGSRDRSSFHDALDECICYLYEV